jgi:DNA/RNA endonuclease G (NUC1)
MTTAEAVEPALPTEPAELQAGKAKFDKHINPYPLIAAPVSGEVRLVRTGYTVSYNPRLRQPNYVAWTLTAPRTYGNNKREPQFYEDAQLATSQRTLLNDYYNSGMSRGHMCPAADNKWNAQAMQESFILSNVCPQTYTLNGEDWEHLESFCRTFVRRNKTAIHIICGPIFTSNPPQLRRKRLHEKRVKAMLSESNPFFARRICRWIDHPEKDPDLTWAVQCGKYPSLLVYLKKAANQNR